MQLLTTRNPKVAKGAAYGWHSAVLHLAPWRASGVNVCPMAEAAGCIDACLNTSGQGGIAKGGATFIAGGGRALPDNRAQRARIRRTELWAFDPTTFYAQLAQEIAQHAAQAARASLRPCVRLNGTSDLPWHAYAEGRALFEAFPDVQFYDYTKVRKTALAWNSGAGALWGRYHITYSYSHARAQRPGEEGARERGMLGYYQGTVAVVFEGKQLPTHYKGRPVIDGDVHDLRFLDRPGVIAGLRAKGAARPGKGRALAPFVVPRAEFAL